MAALGTVVAINGTTDAVKNVIVVTESGVKKPLHLGDTIQPGDTIITPNGVIVELQLQNGKVMQVFAEQLVKFTPEFADAIPPSSGDSAVDQATIQAVIKAINEGRDIGEVLEETAAGLSGGGSTVYGFDIVNLLRIVEQLNPVAFQFESGRIEIPEINFAFADPNQGAFSGAPATPPVDNLPVAVNDTVNATEDAVFNGNLAANDTSSADGGNVWALGTGATHGTVIINANGTFSYTPNANYNGPDSFTYTITDADGDISTATVTVNVAAVNDIPVANPDVASTPINTAINNINVKANDIDADGDTLIVSSPVLANPALGTVTLNPDGTINFVPAPTTTGPVIINYTLSDNNGGTSVGTLTVNVGNNTPPTGANNTFTFDEDTSKTFAASDFGFNDVDLGQTLLTVRIDSLPSAGSLKLNGTDVIAGQIILQAQLGNLVFTPAPNANGANYASFTFSVQDNLGAFDTTPNTITLNVTPVNDAPVLSFSNTIASLTEGTATVGMTITDANATDEDGDTLSYSLVAGSDPNGYYAINASTGLVTLTAAGVAHVNAGGDLPTVQVQVSDGTTSVSGSQALPTTTDVNDAPVLSFSNTIASLTEGTATVGMTITDANATDEDGDTLSYSLVAGSDPNGYYAINASTGLVTLTAAGVAHVNAGGDLPTVQVQVSDGTTSVSGSQALPTTTDVNDAPVLSFSNTIASLTEGTATVGMTITDANATDEDGDTLSYSLVAGSDPNGYYAINASTGLVTLTAAGVAHVNAGGDLPTVQVQVSDGTTSVSGSQALPTTTDVNDAPVLSFSNTIASLTEGTATVGMTITDANATDEDGDTLSYSLVAGSDPNGYYAINASTGLVTLTAAGVAHVNAGGDLPTVQVQVSDGTTSVSGSQALPTTTDVNDAPVLSFSNTIASLTEGTATVGMTITDANATDEDGDTLSYSLVAGSDPNGYYAINASTGLVTLTAAGVAHVNAGGDLPTVQVQVSDGTTSVSGSQALPTTTDVNDAPVLSFSNTIASLTEGTATVGMTITDANATDEDGDTLSYSLVAGSDPNGYYAINASTGLVTLTAAGVAHVNAGGDLPTVQVQVSDGTTSVSGSQALPTTTDVNDAPVLSFSNTIASLTEGTATVGMTITDANATDEDGDTLSYSLVAGSDPNGYYAINASTGLVTLTAAGVAHVNAGGDLPTVQVQVSDGTTSVSGSQALPTTTDVNDAPVLSFSNTIASLTEGTATVGMTITDANATDEDGDTLSYSLVAGSDPNGYYAINASTGLVTLTAAGVAHVNAGGDLPTVQVQVSDGTTSVSGSQALPTTTDVNDAPVLSFSNTIASLTEGTATVGMTITDANATDEDGDTLSYSLVAGSDPNGYYAINASTGLVTLTAAGVAHVNAGGDLPTVQVQVSDGTTSVSGSQALPTTTDVNDAPVLSFSNTIASLTEGTATVGMTITDANATDEDGDTLSYSLVAGSDPNGYYAINASTGLVTLTAAGVAHVNAGGDLPTVQVQVSDGTTSVSGSQALPTTTDVNDAPVLSFSNTIASLTEGTATVGMTITDANATDEDGDTLSYSLVAGSDPNGYYAINASTGLVTLTAAGVAHVNAGGDLPTVQVQVSDGTTSVSGSQALPTTTDVNDAPVLSFSNTIASLTEGTATVGMTITDANATDEDGDTLSYSLVAGSDPNGYYAINASTGLVTLTAAGVAHVNAGGDLPTVQVQVSDGTTSVSGSQALPTTTDVNDAPVLSFSNTIASLTEGTATVGMTITDANATDEDGDTLSYSLVAGSDPNGYYAINASTGLVTLTAAGVAHVNAGGDLPTVQVQVSDGTTSVSGSQALPTTTDVNDAPVLSFSNTIASLTEGTATVGMTITDANATDEDGDTLSYSLVAGSDPNGYYAINASTGLVTLTAAGVAHVNAGGDLPTVQVQVSDGTTSVSGSQALPTTTDVNDAPVLSFSNTIASLTEGTATVGMTITDANATDEDGDTLSYSLVAGSDPNGYYAINASTGLVTLTAAGVAHVNAGGDLPTVQVQVSDGTTSVSGSQALPTTTDVNDAPVLSFSNTIASLTEGTATVGMTITDANATDEDGDTLSYSLVAGSDPNGYYAINASTGLVTLTAAGVAHVNAGGDLPTVQVQVSDGTTSVSGSQALPTTTDVNDAPVLSFSNTIASLTEGTATVGMTITDANATDEDGDTLSYSLVAGSDPNGYYAINASTGLVTLTAAGVAHVNAGGDLPTVQVQVSDGTTSVSGSQALPTTTDVNDAPVLSFSNTIASLTEGTATVGMTITDANATDEDGDTLSYSLVAGSDPNGYYAINASTGLVTLTAAGVAHVNAGGDLPTVQVQVSDGTTSVSGSQALPTTTDVNDAPVLSFSNTIASLTEGTATVGMTITDANATDEDGDTLSYSLVAGSDPNGYYAINASTGLVTLTAAGVAHVNAGGDLPTVQVQVSDGTTSVSGSQALPTTTDVNDAPVLSFSNTIASLTEGTATVGMTITDANATDEDGDTLSYSLVAGSDPNGYYAINASTGLVTLTAAGVAHVNAGGDLPTVQVQVSDGTTSVSGSQALPTTTDVNDAPVLSFSNTIASLTEGTATVGMTITDANATDEDGDTLSYSLVAGSDPNGYYAINASTGLVTLTAAGVAHVNAGGDLPTVQVQVSDGTTSVSGSQALPTTTDVNDAPVLSFSNTIASLTEGTATVGMTITDANATDEDGDTLSYSLVAGSDPNGYYAINASTGLVTLTAAGVAHVNAGGDLPTVQVQVSDGTTSVSGSQALPTTTDVNDAPVLSFSNTIASLTEGTATVGMTITDANATDEDGDTLSYSLVAGSDPNGYYAINASTGLVTLTAAGVAHVNAGGDLPTVQVQVSDGTTSVSGSQALPTTTDVNDAPVLSFSNTIASLTEGTATVGMTITDANATDEDGDTLSYSLVAGSDPNGYYAINASTGLVTLTAAGVAHVNAGGDLPTVQVQVSDGTTSVSGSQALPTTTDVNDAPVLSFSNTIASLTEGTATVGMTITDANATDEDGDTLSYSLVAGSDPNGYYAINASTGLVTLTAAGVAHVNAGGDLPTVQVQVSDGTTSVSGSQALPTTTDVNDAPVLSFSNTIASLTEGTATVGMTITDANATDEDGDTLSYSLVAGSDPNGYYAINASTGLVTLTAAGVAHVNAGGDLPTVQVQVSDGTTSVSGSQALPTTTDVNDAPVLSFSNTIASLTEGTATVGMTITDANATDEDGDTLSYSLVAGSDPNGYYAINASTGLVTLTAAGVAHVNAGGDLPTVQVQVSDGTTSVSGSQALPTTTDVNDAPVLSFSNTIASLTEGTATVGMTITDANATDEDGDTLSYSLVAGSDPNGYYAINASTGLVTLTAAGVAHVNAGGDLPTVQVQVSDGTTSVSGSQALPTTTDVNDAPVLSFSNTIASLTEGTATVGMTITDANATDEDGDTLSYSLVAGSDPNGYYAINASTGLVTLTAAGVAHVNAGGDLPTVQVQVSDGTTSVSGSQALPTTTDVNDAPVLSFSNTIASLTEGTATVGMTITDANATDEDGDTLSYSLVAGSDPNGYYAINASTGLVTLTAAGVAHVNAGGDLPTVQVQVSDGTTSVSGSQALPTTTDVNDAPVLSFSNTIASLTEGTATVGMTITDANATDEDGDTLSYSLVAGSDPNGYYAINASTGLVTLTAAGVAHVNAGGDLPTVQVQVSDGTTSVSGSQALPTTTDVNDAPVLSFSNTIASLTEGTATVGMTITDANATDEDGDTLSYSLVAGSDPNGYYAINASTGLVTLTAAGVAHVNAGGDLPTVQVQVSDGTTSVSGSQALPTTTDVNDAPVLSFSNTIASLTEGTATVGMTITDANATDEDGDTLSYSLVAGSDPNGYYAINASTGLVTLTAAGVAHVNAGGDLPTVQVQVSDGTTSVSGSQALPTTTDVNDAPVLSFSNTIASLTEGTATVGMTITDANATDEDGDTLSYSLVAGSDPNGYYAINASTGLVTLTAAGVAHVNAGGDLPTVQVQVSDGTTSVSGSQALPTTTDVNDAPVLSFSNTIASLTEGTATVGMTITDANATDEDGDTLSYSLVAGSDPNGYYAINASTGLVTLTAAGVAHVNAGGDLPTVQVQVSDGTTSVSGSQALPTTTDVNDAPVLSFSNTIASLTEGTATVGMTITDANATDEDGDTLSYSLVAGSDPNGYYAINASTGLVTLTAAGVAHVNAGGDLPTVQVQVSDGTTSVSGSQALPTTTDVNDAPVLSFSNTIASLTEGTATVGMTITDANATDEDGDTLSYSLVAGSDPNGYYAINASTGLVTLTAAGVAHVNAGGDLPTVQVQVSDGTTSVSGSQALPTTTDVNDAPVLSFSNTIASLTEGTATVGMTITDANATDEDGDTLSYSLVAGSDPNGYYAINASTGLVTLTAAGVAHVNAGGDLPTVQVQVSDGTTSVSGSQALPTTTDVNDAPVLSFSNTIASLTEGTATVGMTITDANATDEDGDTLSYSLVAGSDPNGYYAINASTGLVTLTAAGVAHVNAGGDLPTVQVQVSDGTTSVSGSQALPTTTDVNDAPVLSFSNTIASLTEGTATVGMTITDANATDEDGDTLSYSLVAGSDPNGYYAINASTGLVTLTAAGVAHVNAGGDLPTVQVQVSDGTTSVSGSQALPTTTDVNDAPVLSFSNTIASLTEGTATVGMTITDANATDEDGDTLSYSLVAGSDPNGYYAINASTGLVTLTAAGVAHVNAGGDLPTVQVQVSDGTTSVSGSQALPTTTDVNDAPVLSFSNTIASLTEGTATVGMTITDANATDEDGDTLSYSLVAGSDPNGYYAINASTGLVTLTAAGVAHVNAGGDLPTVQVQVSDGTTSVSGSQALPTTTDVNDAPVLSFSNTIASLTEGTATVGMTITDANATDEDGDTLSYSLVAGSDPNGYYAINASTGLVTLTAAGVAHVNAGGDLPTVQVQVSDGTTSVSGSQALPTTTDVNDAPVNTVPGTLTTNEDVALAISGLSVTDEDAGSGSMTVTLAVTNGILNVSGGTAAISGSGTGTVTLTGTAVQINATLAATVNYVPTSNYSGGATFTMTTNDNGNSGAGGPLSDTDAVAINVTAVADAPLVYVLPQVFGVNASLAAANVSTGTGTTQATIETTLGLTGGILDTYDPAANPGLGTNDPGTIDATTGGFVNQNVSIQTGQQVAIGWSFTNTENLTDINAGYNDFLVLVVTNPSGGKTYTLISSAEATGAGPATLSGTYNFTATTAGDYQFSWVVMNGRDTQVQSTMTINAPKYVIGGTNYAPPVYIPIAANLVDTDGSESLSYTITGVPTGATFSAGTSLGGGVWSFTPAQVAGLHIYPADGYTGIMNLTLNVTSTEASNGATAVTSQAFTVEVSGTTASQYGTNANNTLTGTAGNDLLEGFAGNDTIAGAAGNDVIYGDAGTDILDGGANNDVLYGGAGNDTLTGGTGQDRLVGGAGNDTMQGGSGSDDGNMDVFQWSLADAGTAGAPAVDTINFFGTAAATAGGDVLDIRDLLSGESRDAAVLDNYLHFQFSGGNTTVYISSSGAFGDGNTVGAPSGTVTANSVQNIVLNGVDLIGGSTTDMQVIQNLLNNNKLITD